VVILIIIIAGRDNQSIEWYTPSRNEWTYGPALSHVHYQGAAVTLNGRIHINGGYSASGAGNSIRSFLYIHSIHRNDIGTCLL
jgi:hypothetical protein